MTLRSISAALALGVVAVPLAGRADAVPDAAKQAITADYQQFCTAAQDPTDANLNAMGATLAADFVNVDFKGKEIHRDEYIAQGKQQLKQLHVTSCDNTIDSMTLSDPNTIVVAVTGKIAGQIQAPDGNHDLEATTGSQDTWKLQNGTWLQSQSKDTSALVKIDGKVVQDEGS